MKIIDGKPEYKGALVSVACVYCCQFDGLRLCICQVMYLLWMMTFGVI